MTQKKNNPRRKILHNKERLKELSCISQISDMLKAGRSYKETMNRICHILPSAFQYPDYTAVRVKYGSIEAKSIHYKETPWKLTQSVRSLENKVVKIEVVYFEEFEDADKGPFLTEEQDLLTLVIKLLQKHFNSYEARKQNIAPRSTFTEKTRVGEEDTTQISRQLLKQLINRNSSNRDVFHDLMPFKVSEILLVATLYDAYSIEKEGQFTEQILGEYYQLNLTSIPRVTTALSPDEALDELRHKHFDLVIIMMGTDKTIPKLLSQKIKEEFDYLQVFLLLNNNSELSFYNDNIKKLDSIDQVFVWNGDSKVFFAMVKLLEDRVNLENDIEIGLVGVILLIEDSPIYYSRYLPMLFQIVLGQTKRLIEEVNVDELYKVLRLRARPKIIHVADYEEAIYVYERYKDYMLCVISDMKFYKEGRLVPNAGEQFVRHVKSKDNELPMIIQSSDSENESIAAGLNVGFINKNSDSLIHEIRRFIKFYLGFGDFVYKTKDDKVIDKAETLQEFEEKLATIPDESLLFHATRNHFSQWLLARGEIHIARIIHPVRATDFKGCNELRSFILNIIETFRHEQKVGKIVPFNENAINNEKNIASISSGALGGKGRGLAFIHSLIYNFDFPHLVKGINIKAPRTAIIGTDEYELFIEKNELLEKAFNTDNYNEIRKLFLEGSLSDQTVARLRVLLEVIKKPLAVRSSGLFEDSLTRPFAGIFETYKLPNNHDNPEVRLSQLTDAIKLVYASVFSNNAKGYIEAVNHKIEEEKMAVVIQEVVGSHHENVYYPHISGVAQSYNYYPYAHMHPSEGFVIAAVGLGKYVVDGEKAYRFSPRYPTTQNSSLEDQIKNSQIEFYAVNMEKKELNLIEGEDAGLIKMSIHDAERHGNLKHCASVYDINNDRLVAGLDQQGPRIVNFANILNYEYIPLAKTIEVILSVVREALGTPVEVEFAVDLKKDKSGKASFYLLQIKPLIGNAQDYNVNLKKFPKEDIILLSDRSMGNGKITDIVDIIYVDNSKFDKGKTLEMAVEIAQLNQKMILEGRRYILIGPGRWGTRDRFIGIPVSWPQISNAKVIVETSLEGFPLDASLGSHFFHNVTSMDVGYLSVQSEIGDSFIEYKLMDRQNVVQTTKYFKHVRFSRPVTVRMDGKKRIAVITI